MADYEAPNVLTALDVPGGERDGPNEFETAVPFEWPHHGERSTREYDGGPLEEEGSEPSTFPSRSGWEREPEFETVGLETEAIASPQRSTRSWEASAIDRPEPTGAYIPSSYFRFVDGLVVNEDGEPIEDAVLLVAEGEFPTAATVEGGAFSIALLRQVYDSFRLLVQSDQPGLDLVWYEFVEQEIGLYDEETTLMFEETNISSGINHGIGVELGGL